MDLGPKMLPNEASNETDDRDTKSGLFQQVVHTPIKPPWGFVAQIGLRPDFRFLRTDLSYGLCSGDAKRCEAIEDRGADLDLSNLPIEVSRREALTEQFHAMHPLPGSRCLQR
jgi:hypothetical protein